MSDFDLSRRGLAGLASGLFGTMLPLPAAAAPASAASTDKPKQSSAILKTPLGGLIGQAVEKGGNRVTAYKGIPYAQPPVGSRRWRPAEPAAPWNCTRDATAFGPQAVQVPEPDAMFYSLPQAVQSEDCLYLNVWTPAASGDETERLPVMVWIHGGAFMTGAGSLPVYDGAALARKGVVVVTINYRLGVLGYFAHPELIAEAQGGICANFGTTDQIEALRWVKNNIAAFGGDPDNVTIFGQSAGAMSVSMLMTTPMSKGLFHRAIGQSGGFFFPMRTLGRPSWGGPPAEELGAAFGKRLGAATLADLRALPAQTLAAAAPQNGDLLNELGALMVVDGLVFEKSVLETFREGTQHAVPVLVGFNSDEASGIADYGAIPVLSDPVAYEKDMRQRYGALADGFLARYPARDPQAAAFDAFRDGGFGWPVLEWAALMSRVQRSTYLYYFSHTPPGADAQRPVFGSRNTRRVGAFHAAEIAYVFNNVDRDVLSVWCDDGPHPNRPAGAPRAEDIRLADTMSDYWVSFAKIGVPEAGASKWAPYDDAAGRYMHFDNGATPSQHLLPGMRDLNNRVESARKSAGTYWYLGDVGARGQVIS
ncbi:MAG TPA: carboxylesterase/lipase family protein [Rhizomicrobium sp.]|nr:carboxylesterase/lipase family protein [Rhizomicrobium sp.]